MTRMSEIPAEILAEMTPAVRAFVESLLAQMAKMQAEIDELKSQVKRLTPQNSSVPPSTQHPHARPTPKPKPKSKKKRGGQLGHRRVIRELVPIERCSEVIPLIPEDCRRCGKGLTGKDPEPIRHQVWELPKIEPIIVEYQQHRLTCTGCGTSTCATLPAGVPTGQFGAKLLAFTGLLMGHFRQSKRRAALFLSDLLNMPCCPAATVKMQNRVSQALEQPYENLKSLLANEKQLCMDESPTKQANQKAWLWTAVASTFAVFAIFASRAATALPKLLGDRFKGIINCDRAKMYWRAERLQWCWAHLKRDIQSLIDHHDHQVKRLGFDLMRSVEVMFIIWQLGLQRCRPDRQDVRPWRRRVHHRPAGSGAGPARQAMKDHPAAYLANEGSALTVDKAFYTRIAEGGGRTPVEKFTIPIRTGRAWKVPAGHVFRIVTVEGPQVGDLNIWNAHNPRERLWASRTRQLQAAHVTTFDPMPTEAKFSRSRI